jgi:hypothetical protein
MPNPFEELTRLRERELAALWQRGTSPAPSALDRVIFRGRNTGALARYGPGGGAFAKGFLRTGDLVDGCNFTVRVRAGSWQVAVERPYGFFAVEPASPEHLRPAGPPAGLLLDYGRGRAAAFRARGAPRPPLPLRLVELAARPLRDILVQPPDFPPQVLLGRAYFAALPITYFVLEAFQPLSVSWAEQPAAAGRPRRRAS